MLRNIRDPSYLSYEGSTKKFTCDHPIFIKKKHESHQRLLSIYVLCI